MSIFDRNVRIEINLDPRLSSQLDRFLGQIDRFLEYLNPNRVVGVGTVFHPPVPRPGEPLMATMKLLKKSSNFKMLAKHKKGDPPIPDYGLQDNEDGSFTIFGVNAAGTSGIDISDVATMTATSDAPAVMSVDPPVGMTDQCHGLSEGVSNVTAVITWNDGSIGPFTSRFTGTVKKDPVAVGVGPPVFGPPVIR